MTHICDIMGLTGATLGEEIVIKNNYQGEILDRFQSEELIEVLNYNNIEYRIVKRRIHFTKTPSRRSSKPDAWRALYRIGTLMFENSPGVWLQESFRQNPVI